MITRATSHLLSTQAFEAVFDAGFIIVINKEPAMSFRSNNVLLSGHSKQSTRVSLGNLDAAPGVAPGQLSIWDLMPLHTSVEVH